MRKIAIGSFLIIVFVTTTSTAYYDNTTGRWLQRDPLGYADGMNFYEYAKNNPVVNTDPKGLKCCEKDKPKFGRKRLSQNLRKCWMNEEKDARSKGGRMVKKLSLTSKPLATGVEFGEMP